MVRTLKNYLVEVKNLDVYSSLLGQVGKRALDVSGGGNEMFHFSGRHKHKTLDERDVRQRAKRSLTFLYFFASAFSALSGRKLIIEGF